jgi:hypothetical protein
MAAKGGNGGKSIRPSREVPPAVIIVAIVLIVAVLGAAGFYAFNGGWKTPGQQQAAFNHEFLPIMAAKHGDTEALDAENKLRQSRGQAPLEVPRKKEQMAGNRMEKLAELQRKLGAGQGAPAGQ